MCFHYKEQQFMHKLIFQRNKIIKFHWQGLICIYRDLKRNQTHDILNNLLNAPYNFFYMEFFEYVMGFIV